MEGTTDTAGQTKCSICNAGFRLTISESCTVLCSENNGTYTLEPTADGGGQLTFTMVNVPVGSGLNFFTGVSDNADATVDNPYSIAETELTYAVYKRVRDWATSSERGDASYDIAPGKRGGDSTGCNPDPDEATRTPQHPVTCINWYDSVKFANALSEYCRLTPLYENGNAVMRSGATTPDTPLSTTATGFRLPTNNEWELAARYISDQNNDGDIKDSGEFYPGNFASGATALITNVAATGMVAWSSTNSNNRTHIVKNKAANALGLYDMSGNVDEFTFNAASSNQALRGGSWTYTISGMQVGDEFIVPRINPYSDTGVRLVR